MTIDYTKGDRLCELFYHAVLSPLGSCVCLIFASTVKGLFFGELKNGTHEQIERKEKTRQHNIT